MTGGAAYAKISLGTIMSKAMRTVIGALLGSAAGLVLGVFGWLGFFYVVFMLPNGTPFRYMDQGAIPTVLTGPLGAVIGAVIGCFLSRSRPQPAPSEEADAEPTAPPNGGPATAPGNSEVGEGPPSVS